MKRRKWFPSLQWLLITTIALMNAITWPMVSSLGLFEPLTALALAIALIVIIVHDRWLSRRMAVVYELYYEDIGSGVCPDQGKDVNDKNAWKWYRKRGSPKILDPNRPQRYTRDPAARRETIDEPDAVTGSDAVAL